MEQNLHDIMYHKITNPKTGRKVDTFGKLGRQIIYTYFIFLKLNIVFFKKYNFIFFPKFIIVFF